jgi:flagellar biosynthesis protein FliQ
MMFLAFIGGAIAPRRAWLVGLMLGLPALILSPWTAPRGENDDVWLFIPPVLAVFDVMLIGIAWLGGLVRDSFEQAFEESRTGKKTRL